MVLNTPHPPGARAQFCLSMRRNENKIEGEAIPKYTTCQSYRESVSIRLVM